MFFSLSSSVLILVAGSTVNASPLLKDRQLYADLNGLIYDTYTTSSVVSKPSAVGKVAAPSILSSVSSATSQSVWSWTPSSTSQSVWSPSSTSAKSSITVQTSKSANGKAPPAFTPITSSGATTHPTSATITKAATSTPTSAKANGGSTFTVPISTPKASAKTSIAPHSATASAKATVAPNAAAGNTAAGNKCDGTNDGAVICSADGTQFGLCDHGDVVMRSVSKGTACRNGAIDYIADVLGVALGQVKTYLDSADNDTATLPPRHPNAVDAADCPAALLHLKDSVDKADSNSDALRFVKSTDKTLVDQSDIELVRKPDGTTGFQFQHDCGSKSSGSKDKRQLYILDWLCL